jgi:hypothetical protein
MSSMTCSLAYLLLQWVPFDYNEVLGLQVPSWAFDIKGSDIGSGTEEASGSNPTVIIEMSGNLK